MSTKGRSDYYAPGDWNACCDRCCAKFKASKLKRDWRGFMLCEWCWEPRHPQDFVRGLADPTPVPWTRQCSHDNMVTFCVVPTASFTITVDPDDPRTIHYASTTPSSDACPVTCEYDFGDGSTSTTSSGSHQYADTGGVASYMVAYTATNSAGSAAAAPQSVSVDTTPAPPAERIYTIDFEEATTTGPTPTHITSVAQGFDAIDAYVWSQAQLADPGYLAEKPTGVYQGQKFIQSLLLPDTPLFVTDVTFLPNGINVGWKFTEISIRAAVYANQMQPKGLVGGVWVNLFSVIGADGSFAWNSTITHDITGLGGDVLGIRFSTSANNLFAVDSFTVKMVPV